MGVRCKTSMVAVVGPAVGTLPLQHTPCISLFRHGLPIHPLIGCLPGWLGAQNSTAYSTDDDALSYNRSRQHLMQSPMSWENIAAGVGRQAL